MSIYSLLYSSDCSMFVYQDDAPYFSNLRLQLSGTHKIFDIYHQSSKFYYYFNVKEVKRFLILSFLTSKDNVSTTK